MIGQQDVWATDGWAEDIWATRAGQLGNIVGLQSINIIDTVIRQVMCDQWRSALVQPTITKKSLMRCMCHLCEQKCLQQVPKAVKYVRSGAHKCSGKEFKADE